MGNQKTQTVEIWTDGSGINRKGLPNSGHGGWGAILICGEHRKELYGGCYTNTTSARMEIRGVLEALRAIKFPCYITIYCDNQYVCYTLEKRWLFGWIEKGILDSKANSDLWKQVLEEVNRLGGIANIRMKWVKGHAGTELNERADQLADLGRRRRERIDDTQK